MNIQKYNSFFEKPTVQMACLNSSLQPFFATQVEILWKSHEIAYLVLAKIVHFFEVKLMIPKIATFVGQNITYSC